ncbi:MAG: single-stranded-DNA-specific exonuclease RecJ [Candidatus Kerfeldbacteria bacterium CG08_land_8_20_14_0_20_43_14]|uniref:Single-stranded-DNA-specific exonuclease RecJ n=1 Tax=Candidatus Kerfeldbacteria bacterium CG08_land_8_20_14_0_20_43_14 TaxID=2014246 RepID=A0A2H0YPI3_9BACT|nr:MAG: single-stranded-DNA-specific exonuclease RecJ [Candidatus Kerfeldbacteria bacterium CG08_land_8_20_14_0_20_43_14]
MEKIWHVAEPVSPAIKQEFPELDDITLQLLWNRGLKDQKGIDEFLKPDWLKDIHDPFLFVDMGKAVARIFKAIEKQENIIVHGDYDADGVCASAILFNTLKALGAKVDVYLPHREREGYGLNLQTIDHLHEVHKANLIITCDCGTSNYQEVERAKELKIEVIITDHHHEPVERPKAFALINPRLAGSGYPFPGLAGSGVAFKLAQALIRKSDLDKIDNLSKDGFEKWLLDFVAISTITDFMPLVGENRTLVSYGLIVLKKTPRPGLRAMCEVMGTRQENIDTTTIGFQIGPRLNAAGRMDHASTAFRLLISQDYEESKSIAIALNESNIERQKLTEEIVAKAKGLIGSVGADRKILTALGEGWPVGVVGLVAGRLADEFHRPVLIMTKHDDLVVGSGRSIPSYDITQALVRNKQFLERFGGHAGACGFTLTLAKIEDFSKAILADANHELKDSDLLKEISIESEVALKQISFKLLNVLEDFEPFGEGNPKPLFVCRGMAITELQPVGKDKRHLRIVVNHQTAEPRKFIAFGFGEVYGPMLTVGDKIDIVFSVDRNEWNGTRELQLKVIDLKFS